MKFLLDFKIENAVATMVKNGQVKSHPDMTRPALAHVMLQYKPEYQEKYGFNAQLVAADGFILAVVPANMDDQDSEGLIDPAAFVKARRLGRKNKSDVGTIHAVIRCLSFTDGSEMPRTLTGPYGITDRLAHYPDISRIVPNREITYGPAVLSLNANYILRLGEALGAPYNVRVMVNPKDRISPLFVDAIRHGQSIANLSETIPVPPYGVMMPTNNGIGTI